MDSPTISVNGQPHVWPQAKPLISFLSELNLPPQVAIAINGAIVPRSQHATTSVAPGDQIEIVHAVGGG